MNNHSHKDFEWKNKYDLYFKEEKVATLEPVLFQINWLDGTKSDIYNLTQAKENAQREYTTYLHAQDSQEKP